MDFPGPISWRGPGFLNVYYINFWTRNPPFRAETPYTYAKCDDFPPMGACGAGELASPNNPGGFFPGPISAPSE